MALLIVLELYPFSTVYKIVDEKKILRGLEILNVPTPKRPSVRNAAIIAVPQRQSEKVGEEIGAEGHCEGVRGDRSNWLGWRSPWFCYAGLGVIAMGVWN